VSSGDDGLVVLWNLKTGETLQEISCAFHGPVSALAWVGFGEDKDESFIFGCADGSLHLYRRTDPKVSAE
jgi:hypothetical protein